MSNLVFNVDTTPMALTIDTAKGHMNGVTGAVVAMQSAVIAAEKDCSNTICENVDNGFYMLIKSQISQKAVAALTEMESKQITLLQLRKALDKVEQQMEADFFMISKRYAKLFNSLNKALEIRVREIDRPAMQLAEIRKSIVFDKLKDDSSMLFSVTNEALPVTQTALAGKLKQKTRDAMLTLSVSIDENASYNDKVESILLQRENETAGDSDYFYLPVVIAASDSLINANDTIDAVYTAQSEILQNSNAIVSEISRMQKELQWTNINSEDKNSIRREFAALCEKNSLEKNLSEKMLKLFDESTWEALQK